jgi:predicted site-specific integrase-resolvase
MKGDFMDKQDGIDRVRRYKPTAESLGISTKTLQRLITRGAIKTVQITDRIRGVTDSERARFIKSRVMGGA